jgi:serine/threonine-protein kinase
MSSVRPGDVLAGKYRVERVLGSGGMGYVVAARHLQLDQLVAMKFLRRGSLDDTEATGRFLREARASVRLRNEHVARVFDVGTLETGEPYIVMEHLDGCDLSALAKQRGTISAGETVEYVMQACEALSEAHSLGIIHRDIKLANLFLTRGPAGAPLVKVLDFGISKTNPFGESEHEMTRTSSMLGSPRFMSPEQMRDPRAVDGRSDIWSLGVVMYRLVAGRAPFEADTLGRLLTMVMHEQPDPLEVVRPDLPPGFAQVVGRCLEKDPAQRFANVAELAYALAAYAIEPARARVVADRIAATLSVARVPTSVDVSITTGDAPSPAGGNDTGTASPWSGSHASRATRKPKSSVMWAAVGALAILAGVGGFAKIRYDRARAAAEAPPPAAVADAPAPSGPAPSSAPPPAEPPVTQAAGAGEAPLVAVATPKPIEDRAGAKAPSDDKPKRPAAHVTPPPARRPQPAARPAPPSGDGIPSTRD